MVYAGQLSVVATNGNSYFNDLTVDGGTLTYLSLDSDTWINGDLHLVEGSLDPLSNDLYILGNWTNDAGEDGFIHNTSFVHFEGTSQQALDDDEEFYYLVLNNNSPGLIIDDGTVECDTYNWTSGTLQVNNGATFIAQDLFDDGIKGNFILNTGGHIELHSSSYVHLKGDVTINGGVFDVYGGVLASYWPYGQSVSLTMSDGEFNFHDQGLYIHDNDSHTFTGNITGGTIGIGGYFLNTSSEFNPTGGDVVFIGNSSASITLDPGSAFHRLVINKSGALDSGSGKDPGNGPPSDNMPVHTKKAPVNGGSRSGTITVSSDLYINDQLKVDAGEFDVGPYDVNVSDHVYIGGTLTMTDPAGRIDTERSFSWTDGSAANVTDGIITYKEDFNFFSGTSAQLSGNNVVRAVGTVVQDLACHDDDAGVNDLVISNTSQPINLITHTNHFRVFGDMTLLDNTEIDIDDSLWVGGLLFVDDLGTLTVDEGGLYCDDDLTVNGTFHMIDGNVRIMDDFYLNTGGVLTIDDGNFIIDEPYSGGYAFFLGTTNHNNGIIQVTNQGISFGPSSSYNAAGGILKVGYRIQAVTGGTFQPAAGTLEMSGGYNGQIALSNGNYCNDLVIDKSQRRHPSLLVQGMHQDKSLHRS